MCWNTVCKSRDEGRLGVKNVEILNATLISKWKWRIILSSRYINLKLKVLIGDKTLWIIEIQYGGGISCYQIVMLICWRIIFAEVVSCCAGNGSEIPL